MGLSILIPAGLGLGCAGAAVREFWRLEGRWIRAGLRIQDQRSGLEVLARRLGALRERLGMGDVPEESAWAALGDAPGAWAGWVAELARSLRSRGAAVSPTLARLERLARGELESGAQARARLAQAWAQALVCGGMVPGFAVFFGSVVPEVTESAAWAPLVSASAALSLGAAAWILRIGRRAGRGGLGAAEAGWPTFAFCAGEVLLAWVKAGDSADSAWTRMTRWLQRAAPDLHAEWGGMLWEPSARAAVLSGAGLRETLLGLGSAFRQAIQASVFEGRPCAERIEQALEQLRLARDTTSRREWELIPSRVLKPLFLALAPALLGLAFGALAILAAREGVFGGGL